MTFGSFINQIIPYQDFYTIFSLSSTTQNSPEEQQPVPNLVSYDKHGGASPKESFDPNDNSVDSNDNSVEALPMQPSYPSSTAKTNSIGDYVHRRFPDWVYGKHCVDPCLWNKGEYKIESISRYKSDLFRKGLNTPAAVAKNVVASHQTETTNTKHFEHQWVVAKAVDPSSNRSIWVTTWKDSKGNIHAQEFSSLEAANRTASHTFGNDAGRGIKKVGEIDVQALENFKNESITIGSLITYIKSIQAGYHLTLCNCMDYAKNIMNAFFGKIPSSSGPIFTKSEFNQIKEAAEHATPPSAEYTTKEKGIPLSRKVVVYKDGKKIFTCRRAHTKDARQDAELLINDDRNRDREYYESMEKLRSKISNSPFSSAESQVPQSPPKLKIPEYTTKEYGSRGSRKVEVIDESGTVVARFTAKHFKDAREQANAWAKNDIQTRGEEHDLSVKEYEQKLDQYNTQQQRTRQINQLKTGVASAMTTSIIENYQYANTKEYKTFAKNVTKDTALGSAVTVGVGAVSNYVPYYSTACSVVRSLKDVRVRSSEGQDLVQSIGNPGVKIVLNIAVPALCSAAIASNPITGGIALAFYAKGVDSGVNWLTRSE